MLAAVSSQGCRGSGRFVDAGNRGFADLVIFGPRAREWREPPEFLGRLDMQTQTGSSIKSSRTPRSPNMRHLSLEKPVSSSPDRPSPSPPALQHHLHIMPTARRPPRKARNSPGTPGEGAEPREGSEPGQGLGAGGGEFDGRLGRQSAEFSLMNMSIF